MTLRWIEGFGCFGSSGDQTTLLAQKYDFHVAGTCTGVTGRFGGAAMQFASTVQLKTKNANVPSNQVWIVGGAFKVNSLSSGSTSFPLIAFYDSAGAAIQVQIYADSSGILKATRGTSSQIAAATSPILSGTWYYLEVYIVIANAAATLNVNLDGVQIMTFTGDTQDTANANASEVIFGTNGSTTTWDDIYINDNGGFENNSMLGEVKVSELVPNTNGGLQAWSVSSGTAYDTVNDVPPNDDTDYIFSGNTNDTSTFHFDDLADNPSRIFGLQLNAYARKDDIGIRAADLLYYDGSNQYTNGNPFSLSNSYKYYYARYEGNPGTFTTWSPSDINGGQFGITITG